MKKLHGARRFDRLTANNGASSIRAGPLCKTGPRLHADKINPTASHSPLPPRIALVLAGGAARGAYEVGVLQHLQEEVARDPEVVSVEVRLRVWESGIAIDAQVRSRLGSSDSFQFEFGDIIV